jgi:Vitamin K-dependent gamma-carboxylase
MKKLLQNYLRQDFAKSKWPGFLRISTALIALLHFCSIQADFDLLFSYNGLVQPDILNAKRDTLVPSVFTIHTWVTSIVSAISYTEVLYFFRFAFFVTLIMLCIGLFSRVSALLALLIQLILVNSMHFYQYGADSFTTILLFYCFLFPVGKSMSVSNLISKNKAEPDSYTTTRCLRMLQIHICIVYFIGGFDKIQGYNWHNGEALWKALTNHNTSGLIKVDSLKDTPLFLIAGWFTIITEMLYPVFINIRRTRKLWLGLTVGMHIGIAVFLGLFFFSTIMIIFNLAAYYVPYIKEKRKQPAAPPLFEASLAPA